MRNQRTSPWTVPGKDQLPERLLVRLEKLQPANNGIQPLRIKGAVERAQRFTSLFAGQERGAQSRPNPETSNPRESSTCLRVGAQGLQDIFRALRAASPWRPLPASTPETREWQAGCALAERWIG